MFDHIVGFISGVVDSLFDPESRIDAIILLVMISILVACVVGIISQVLF